MVHHWETMTRQSVTAIAPAAVVLIPVGAIEQHGPYLPSGTDTILVEHSIALVADDVARQTGRQLLLASFLRIGSSDHHLPFGGTISLPPSTLLLVLTDAIRSMEATGVKRVVVVNGHGGNIGVCHAAAAAVSTSTKLTVGVINYWDGLADEEGEYPVPGHAGRWEGSLIRSARPDLFVELPERAQPRGPKAPGRGIYGAAIWASIDGYTDEPARATAADGDAAWEKISGSFSQRLSQIIDEMS